MADKKPKKPPSNRKMNTPKKKEAPKAKKDKGEMSVEGSRREGKNDKGTAKKGGFFDKLLHKDKDKGRNSKRRKENGKDKQATTPQTPVGQPSCTSPASTPSTPPTADKTTMVPITRPPIKISSVKRKAKEASRFGNLTSKEEESSHKLDDSARMGAMSVLMQLPPVKVNEAKTTETVEARTVDSNRRGSKAVPNTTQRMGDKTHMVKTVAPTAPPGKPKGDFLKKLEKAGAPFFAHLEQKGWAGIAEEFKVGLIPNFNGELNRMTRYVIKHNVPPDGDYYDANNVELPDTEGRFIVGSLPTPDISGRENFWRMVYDSGVTNVFVLENLAETKKNPFLPMDAHAFIDYGKMNVSNKKVNEDMKHDYQAVLEVLPDGCSNSIIVRFVHAIEWPTAADQLAARFSTLSFVRLLHQEKAAATLIVCQSGITRSCVFLLAHAALARIVEGFPVHIPLLLDRLRAQRFGAIRTIDEYLLVYVIIMDYLQIKHPAFTARCKKLYEELRKYRSNANMESAGTTTNEMSTDQAKGTQTFESREKLSREGI